MYLQSPNHPVLSVKYAWACPSDKHRSTFKTLQLLDAACCELRQRMKDMNIRPTTGRLCLTLQIQGSLVMLHERPLVFEANCYMFPQGLLTLNRGVSDYRLLCLRNTDRLQIVSCIHMPMQSWRIDIKVHTISYSIHHNSENYTCMIVCKSGIGLLQHRRRLPCDPLGFQ